MSHRTHWIDFSYLWIRIICLLLVWCNDVDLMNLSVLDANYQVPFAIVSSSSIVFLQYLQRVKTEFVDRGAKIRSVDPVFIKSAKNV